MSVDDITDKDRLDWLETQMCWIGLDGEFEIKPKKAAGGNYRLSVREACDEGILDAHEQRVQAARGNAPATR